MNPRITFVAITLTAVSLIALVNLVGDFGAMAGVAPPATPVAIDSSKTPPAVPTPEATLTLDEISAYKAAHDTDPHLPLTKQQLSWQAGKEQQVKDWLAAQTAQNSSATAAGDTRCPNFLHTQPYVTADNVVYAVMSFRSDDMVPDMMVDGRIRVDDITYIVNRYHTTCDRPGRIIGRFFYGQANSYFCGPASVAEALNIRHIPLGQDDAAILLTTTSAGTPWSGWYGDPGVPSDWDTGHPIPDVLNYKTNNANQYLPHSVSDVSDLSYYIGVFSYDISNGWPVIGDGREIHNGPRLRGHPNPEVGHDILHWFTISGYEDNGNETDYMDSSTTVWSTVVGWNTLYSSYDIVNIVQGYGYIW